MQMIGPFTAGPEFQIHTDNPQENYPNAVKLSSGIRVTWANKAKGVIYTQRFDDLGQMIDSGPITVGGASGSWTPNPWATAVPTGSIVTWPTGAPGDIDVSIFAQLFRDRANPVGDQFQVNTEIRGGQIEPRALAIKDSLVVTYYSDNRVRGQIYNSTYARLGNELTIQAAPAWQGGLAPFGQGFLSVYTTEASIEGKTFDLQGRALGKQFLITITRTLEARPDVAAWPGHFAVVWWRLFGRPRPNKAIIEGQLFNETLVKIGSVFPVSSEWRYVERPQPRILALSNELIVVWDGNGEIRGRRVTHGGTPVDGEFLIGKGKRPAISATQNGFVVVWAGPAVLGRIYTLPKPTTTTRLPTQKPFLTLPPAATPSSTASLTLQTLSIPLTTSTTPFSLLNFTSLPSTTTSLGTTQLSATFASPVGSDSTTTVLVVVIVGLVLSLCASLGLYVHHFRKHAIEQEEPCELQPTDSSYQYVNLPISKPSGHYQDPPVPRQSTPDDYTAWNVVEEENAKY